ncbi:hypothetical protein [Caulobacter sp. DWR3-1-2]|uniref:hypothetical protein n=1 Tax=Caulobacter sp. DWR3-1-2 TaxID=2804647 RepID=UPI003CF6A379
MRGGDDHFKITTVWDAGSGRHQRVQIAACGKCPHTCAVHDPAHRPTPASVMASKFRGKGWHIAARPAGHLCPRCNGPKPRADAAVGAPKPALSPAQKRAAFCRIAGVKPAAPKSAVSNPPSEEAVMPPNIPPVAGRSPLAVVKPAPVAADPPRQPTREDRRKIMEALDGEYLVDRGCYAKAGSDKALAERLSVPRAWVAEERDRAYGPDACETDGEIWDALKALESRARFLADEGLALAERAEAVEREAAQLRAKLSARVSA